MASGLARGLAAKGKRAAFGDGTRIVWSRASYEVFRNNPNVAEPGQERAGDLVWIKHYSGHRPYLAGIADGRRRWLFRHGTLDVPGELFLDEKEIDIAKHRVPKQPFVVVEPNTAAFKAQRSNKQWPHERYQEISAMLTRAGWSVVQVRYPPPYGPGAKLDGAREIGTRTFREACAILARAALYVGPEGGMHHAAAALGVPAVVIFGGFIAPSVTGYSWHENLYVPGPESPCGRLDPCQHCQRAMLSISTQLVFECAMDQLRNRRPQWQQRKAM